MTNPYQPMPDANPPQGYLPPAEAYYQPLPTGFNPDDPLINPPNSGLNGWVSRIVDMFKRSWKSMLAIFAITQILPMIGMAVLVVVGMLAIGGTALVTGRFDPEAGFEPNEQLLAIGIPLIVLAVFVLIVTFLIMQAAGYAAATYAVTREAAGLPAPLGQSLRYGFRRSLGLAGWQFLVFLIIAGGVLACILPSFYFYAATALFGPIYLFERRNPIGRSFSIFNNNLGRVLGRLALILAATFAVGMLNGVFDLAGQLVARDSDDPTLIIGGTVVSNVVGLLIQLPLAMLTFSAILLTYTEQRGYEGGSTPVLVNELQ